MELIEAAIEFAYQGQPVHPLRPLSKIPLTSHGLHDATTDVDQIEAWWWEYPAANIGLVTGVLFDAVDVDGEEGIQGFLEWADMAGYPLPDPTVRTPSGGYHYYIAPTGAGNRAGMIEHVDYRGAGGFVVAPPSVTEKGSYVWL